MMGKNEKKLTQTSPPGVQHQPFYEPTNIIDPRYLAKFKSGRSPIPSSARLEWPEIDNLPSTRAAFQKSPPQLLWQGVCQFENSLYERNSSDDGN
jgi:hypothetical protein